MSGGGVTSRSSAPRTGSASAIAGWRLKTVILGQSEGARAALLDRGNVKRWIPDHQPSTKLVEKAQGDKELFPPMTKAGIRTTFAGQILLPHSLRSSKSQGGTVNAALSKLAKLHRVIGDKPSVEK